MKIQNKYYLPNSDPTWIIEQRYFPAIKEVTSYHQPSHWKIGDDKYLTAVFRVKPKLTNMDIANEIINKAFAA